MRCTRRTFRRPFISLLSVLAGSCAALLQAWPASAAAPPAGWLREDLPDQGSYLLRYVPQSLDPTKPPPLIVFLHGAGGTPEYYEPYLRDAAEGAGAVLAVPKSSSSVGWGIGNDEAIVAASRDRVAAEVAADANRISIAGHSAGGAYAYLLAYGEASHYSAVFTLSAPYYAVPSVADPAYKAPIRMYYGTDDPNYSTGPRASLEAQWNRLGVAFEEDVVAGYGHNV
ncbi:MAG TPA: alpha/beta fold hydrolase, partial [Thermoanaerobaculia bacterium]